MFKKFQNYLLFYSWQYYLNPLPSSNFMAVNLVPKCTSHHLYSALNPAHIQSIVFFLLGRKISKKITYSGLLWEGCSNLVKDSQLVQKEAFSQPEKVFHNNCRISNTEMQLPYLNYSMASSLCLSPVMFVVTQHYWWRVWQLYSTLTLNSLFQKYLKRFVIQCYIYYSNHTICCISNNFSVNVNGFHFHSCKHPTKLHYQPRLV